MSLKVLTNNEWFFLFWHTEASATSLVVPRSFRIPYKPLLNSDVKVLRGHSVVVSYSPNMEGKPIRGPDVRSAPLQSEKLSVHIKTHTQAGTLKPCSKQCQTKLFNKVSIHCNWLTRKNSLWLQFSLQYSLVPKAVHFCDRRHSIRTVSCS